MTDDSTHEPTAPNVRKRGNKGKKIANSLVALSSAAIVSVYGAGFARTHSAAAQFTTGADPTNVAIAVATSAPTATAAPQATPTASTLFPLATPSAVLPSPANGIVNRSVPTSTSVVPTATATPAGGVAPIAAASAAKYKDGTYVGNGTSRHGGIQATVVIQSGKIVSAEVTRCGTRYPCADIAALPKQVIARQSDAVDLVSGATDSSEAYQGAVHTALAKALVAG